METYKEIVLIETHAVIGTHQETIAWLMLGIVFGSLWNPTAILEVGPLCLSLACCLRRASNTTSTYSSRICWDYVATLTNPTATDDTTSLSDECVSASYSSIEC